MNRNVNASKGLSWERKRYHQKCRTALVGLRRVCASFKGAGQKRSSGYSTEEGRHRRTCSSEQPLGATMPKRGAASKAKHPYLVTRRQGLSQTVSGCVCGMRAALKDGVALPVCKRWVVGTDSLSLDAVLQLLKCPGDHKACRIMRQPGGAPCPGMSSTGKYPQGLGILFVLGLRLPWFKGREYVL